MSHQFMSACPSPPVITARDLTSQEQQTLERILTILNEVYVDKQYIILQRVTELLLQLSN